MVWNPLLWPLLRFLGGCGVSAGDWHHSGSVSDAHRTAEIFGAVGFIFSACSRTERGATGAILSGFYLSLGFAVSLFAILQHFTFNGKLYWIRELQYGGIPFGPYVNRNHYAGLMELLIPPGLAIQILGAERRDQLPLVTLFTLLPIGSLFLSASRGGIISFAGSNFFDDFDYCAKKRKKSICGRRIVCQRWPLFWFRGWESGGAGPLCHL